MKINSKIAKLGKLCIVREIPILFNWQVLTFFLRSFWAIQPWSSRNDWSPKATILAWTPSLPTTGSTARQQLPSLSSPIKSICTSQKSGASHQCNCERWQWYAKLNFIMWGHVEIQIRICIIFSLYIVIKLSDKQFFKKINWYIYIIITHVLGLYGSNNFFKR